MCDTTSNQTPATTKQAMYYIEGTIDAIDIFGNALRFSLLPSSGHLLSRDNGDKKALFIDSDLPNAILIDHARNVNGKEIVWFSIKKCLLHFLMSAKNNRNMIRVWCDYGELKKEETTPPSVNNPTTQASSDNPIIAEGIRVF